MLIFLHDVVLHNMLSLKILAVVGNFSWLYVQAARETGALQAAKNKLEKQVEEMTWRLQLEKRMRASVIALNLLRVLLSCCIVLFVQSCI